MEYFLKYAPPLFGSFLNSVRFVAYLEKFLINKSGPLPIYLPGFLELSLFRTLRIRPD